MFSPAIRSSTPTALPTQIASCSTSRTRRTTASTRSARTTRFRPATSPPYAGNPVRAPDEHAAPLGERLQRPLRRLLLRVLLRAAGRRRRDVAVDAHFHLEHLVVLGPALAGAAVLGQAEAACLQPFLQRRLVVD